MLITISIFSYRNIDRLYKENKKYEYNVFKRPYYEINNVHFRVDKEIDNLITNYINCLENNKNCNFSENYKVKKSFGKYIFVRKKMIKYIILLILLFDYFHKRKIFNFLIKRNFTKFKTMFDIGDA